MEENIKQLITLTRTLQEKRGNPVFIYIDGIRPSAVIETRKSIINFKADPRNKGKDVIDVVIRSGGGSADDAYRLIKLFRTNFREVNVIVPFWAKSAATIFALGASRLILDSCGELGPIDAQVYNVKEDAIGDDWSSALNTFASLKEIEDKALQNVTKMFRQLSEDEDVEISRGHLFDALLSFSSNFYKPLLDKINTNEIGDMSRTLDVGTMYALRILTDFGSLQDRDRIAAFLNYITYECPEHGFVIDYEILSRYLPNVVLSAPESVGEEVAIIIQDLSLLFMDYVQIDRQSKKDYSIVAFLDDMISEGENDDDAIQESQDAIEAKGEQAQPSVSRDGSDSDPGEGAPNQGEDKRDRRPQDTAHHSRS